MSGAGVAHAPWMKRLVPLRTTDTTSAAEAARDCHSMLMDSADLPSGWPVGPGTQNPKLRAGCELLCISCAGGPGAPRTAGKPCADSTKQCAARKRVGTYSVA